MDMPSDRVNAGADLADLRFSNATGILQKKKKKTLWFIGVEVEQETSAPLLKKILNPPLERFHVSSSRWVEIIL